MGFKGIKGGDRVKFRNAFGAVLNGKANALLIFPEHVVVDCGGKHGRPQVVAESNYVSHAGPRPKAPGYKVQYRAVDGSFSKACAEANLVKHIADRMGYVEATSYYLVDAYGVTMVGVRPVNGAAEVGDFLALAAKVNAFVRNNREVI